MTGLKVIAIILQLLSPFMLLIALKSGTQFDEKGMHFIAPTRDGDIWEKIICLIGGAEEGATRTFIFVALLIQIFGLVVGFSVGLVS